MAARTALLAAAVLFAFLLGWVVAPAPRAAAEAGRSLRLADLRLDAPGAAAAQAAAELARDHGAVATPAVPRVAVAAPRPIAAPPPPAPQADAVLRGQLAAVEGQDGDLRLVLAGARRLSTGEDFMGWRVAALSRTSAVLVRGRERRNVDFFAPARPAEAAPVVAGPRLAPPAGGSRPAPTAAEFFSGFKG